MGAVTDIFTPDVPKQPAIFTANDGSVWPTQGDADNRNNEVQRNADRQQARNQGYTGDFGQGGYKRFSENYSQDQNNPGGRYVANNESNVGRSGQDVTAQRNAARAAGYGGQFGDAGYSAFLSQKDSDARNAEAAKVHQANLAQIEERRAADETYFQERLDTITAERKDIENEIPQVTNEKKSKTAKSELYRRLFGQRSLLSSTRTGYNTALGG